MKHILDSKKLGPRTYNALEHELLQDSTLSIHLNKYAHRTSTWKLYALGAFGLYLGSILHYFHYKINVQEEHWTRDYGKDLPMTKRNYMLYKV